MRCSGCLQLRWLMTEKGNVTSLGDRSICIKASFCLLNRIWNIYIYIVTVLYIYIYISAPFRPFIGNLVELDWHIIYIYIYMQQYLPFSLQKWFSRILYEMTMNVWTNPSISMFTYRFVLHRTLRESRIGMNCTGAAEIFHEAEFGKLSSHKVKHHPESRIK